MRRWFSMGVRFYLALKHPEILSFLRNAIQSNKMRDSKESNRVP